MFHDTLSFYNKICAPQRLCCGAHDYEWILFRLFFGFCGLRGGGLFICRYGGRLVLGLISRLLGGFCRGSCYDRLLGNRLNGLNGHSVRRVSGLAGEAILVLICQFGAEEHLDGVVILGNRVVVAANDNAVRSVGQHGLTVAGANTPTIYSPIFKEPCSLHTSSVFTV